MAGTPCKSDAFPVHHAIVRVPVSLRDEGDEPLSHHFSNRLRPPRAFARFIGAERRSKDVSIMRKPLAISLLTALLCFGLASCRDEASLPVEAGTGPNPKLPPPRQRLIPTVSVAHAIGWPDGVKPTAAPGLKVERFAGALVHPRWLYVLPNGDVLVAETNTPAQPKETGLMAWIAREV